MASLVFASASALSFMFRHRETAMKIGLISWRSIEFGWWSVSSLSSLVYRGASSLWSTYSEPKNLDNTNGPRLPLLRRTISAPCLQGNPLGALPGGRRAFFMAYTRASESAEARHRALAEAC